MIILRSLLQHIEHCLLINAKMNEEIIKSLFNWLFQRCWHRPQLNSFRLENTLNEKAFELTYQQTLLNDYRPHPSLTSLTINLLNLSSLDTLLHSFLTIAKSLHFEHTISLLQSISSATSISL